jgi:hypothetical protein
MMNLLIVFTTIICTVISISLFRYASGTLSVLKLNTITYAMYVQVLTVGVIGPVLLVSDSLDFHYMAQHISKPVKFQAWAWSMYALIALPFSMALINAILQVDMKVLLQDYSLKEFDQSVQERFSFNAILALISSLSLAYILHHSPTIPILELLKSGDLNSVAQNRIESKNAFTGINYVRSFLGLILIPCCSYYFYAVAFKSKKLRDWSLFGFQFFLSFILLTYDLQKSPFAFYLLGFLLLHTFITNGLNSKWFFTAVGAAFAMILIGYKSTTGVTIQSQIFNFQSGFYGRIFLSGFLGFPLSLELFPEKINSITTLFGVPQPILGLYDINAADPARQIMLFINEKGAREGSSNLVSGYYLGEAWASYRYAGLVCSPFIVGSVLQLTHLSFLKLPKRPLFIAFYAYISTKWLITSGFSSFLTLKVIFFPVLILILLVTMKNTYNNLIS